MNKKKIIVIALCVVFIIAFSVCMTLIVVETREDKVQQEITASIAETANAAAEIANPYETLKSWEKGGQVESIIKFVEAACDKDSKSYIPEEDRIAVWDMEGTLVLEKTENAPGINPEMKLSLQALKERYKDDPKLTAKFESYESGEYMAAQTASASALSASEAAAAVKAAQYAMMDDIRLSVAQGLTPEEYMDIFASGLEAEYAYGKTYSEIGYLPMIEMYAYLEDHGFKVYIVSGSNRYAVCSVVNAVLAESGRSIAFDRCKGASVDLIEDPDRSGSYIYTDSFEMVDNADKCKIIFREIGGTPVLAFGNSSGDSYMLNMTLANENYDAMAVIINHDDSARELAYDAEKMSELSEKNGWICISMARDFAEIFR